MEIIKASSHLLVDVLFLLKECISDMNSKGLKQWNSANPGEEAMKEVINNGTLYLYTEIGIARGMINLSDECPKEYNEIEWKGNTDKVLYLSKFAVHPVWIETDICDTLISFAEKYATDNGYTSIRLDVFDSYPVGEKFYTGRSFDYAGNFHSEFQKMPFSCFEKNL